jgi:hypothetical protein
VRVRAWSAWMASTLAVAALVRAGGADSCHLRDRLEGAGRAWRLLRSAGAGALQEARPRRAHHRRRAERERAAIAGGRRGRFRHRLERLHSAQHGARGAPIKAVMAVFQKDPQVLITHPRADVKSLADMKGKPIMIADAATVAFWPWLKAKYGFSDAQIRKYTFNLAPFLVDPKAIQEGYLTSEPYTIEKQGISSRNCSCSPTMAIPATPTWCWCRRNGSIPIRARCRPSSMRRAKAGRIICSAIRARQRAHQGRQSRDDGRPDRAGDREDEKLRHRDGRATRRRWASAR